MRHPLDGVFVRESIVGWKLIVIGSIIGVIDIFMFSVLFEWPIFHEMKNEAHQKMFFEKVHESQLEVSFLTFHLFVAGLANMAVSYCVALSINSAEARCFVRWSLHFAVVSFVLTLASLLSFPLWRNLSAP